MQPRARPRFLAALCILTWIGCAVSFLLVVGLLVTWRDQVENLSAMLAVLPVAASEERAVVAASLEWARLSPLTAGVGLLGTSLCVAGAWMMWSLRPSGWHVYTVGELAPPLYVMVMAYGIVGYLPHQGVVLPTLVALLFVGLYRLALRPLRAP